MYRLVPVVVVAGIIALAGCGRSAARGPAWPAPSQTADDGGESIEPQPGAAYASVSERVAEPEVAEGTSAETTAATPAESSDDQKPEAASSASQTPSDDVLMTEEIIIEIEE